MRCLGHTRALKRCKNRAPGWFCHQHRLQPYGLAFSLLTFVGLMAGLFQDLIKPVFWSDEEVALLESNAELVDAILELQRQHREELKRQQAAMGEIRSQLEAIRQQNKALLDQLKGDAKVEFEKQRTSSRLNLLERSRSEIELEERALTERKLFLSQRLSQLLFASLNQSLAPGSPASDYFETQQRRLQEEEKRIDVTLQHLQSQKEALIQEMDGLKRVIEKNVQASGTMARGI